MMKLYEIAVDQVGYEIWHVEAESYDEAYDTWQENGKFIKQETTTYENYEVKVISDDK